MESHTLYDRTNKNVRVFNIDTQTGYFNIAIYFCVYYRIIGELDDIQAIDPDGGPYIHIGMKIGD